MVDHGHTTIDQYICIWEPLVNSRASCCAVVLLRLEGPNLFTKRSHGKAK
jgi:hypothetical protein